MRRSAVIDSRGSIRPGTGVRIQRDDRYLDCDHVICYTIGGFIEPRLFRFEPVYVKEGITFIYGSRFVIPYFLL